MYCWVRAMDSVCCFLTNTGHHNFRLRYGELKTILTNVELTTVAKTKEPFQIRRGQMIIHLRSRQLLLTKRLKPWFSKV